MPSLMGLRIHATTMDAAVDTVFDGLADGRGGIVLTPNIDILRQYRSSPELRSVFEDADVVVADGMPLVVALRLQRTPVPERITGTDLLWALAQQAAVRGRSVLLAGGLPGDAQRAAEHLTQQNPGLRADARPCYVTPDTEASELATLRQTMLDTSPDIVFIGLPFRTQLAAMTAFRTELPSTWFVGVGSSFELVNGDRVRAPEWVQRACLEWAWRLGSQPQHWRRYLVQGMPIAARLLGSALRQRWSAAARRALPSGAPPP